MIDSTQNCAVNFSKGVEQIMFRKTIDRRSRKAMIEFLTNHFRYNTMNSWNASTSYANCVKIYTLDIPSELMDKAYEVIGSDDLDVSDFAENIEAIMLDFHNLTGYTIGCNGRSGGYLVLYESDGDVIYPGRNIDMYEDFSDWSLSDIRERVNLVCTFDYYCDLICDAFRNMLNDYEIKTSTVMVPVKKKCLVTRDA